jgi:hypothetical protein
MKTLKLSIGLDVILSYRRLDYTPWHALAEFIDNAIQSFLDNEDKLTKAYKRDEDQFTVSIQYDRNQDVLIIRDNAMGMSLDELENALNIGRPPDDTSGLSQYGLGMKTAACWFGDLWSVRTKKLGETEGYYVVVDVEAVASNPRHRLKQEAFDAKKNEHYTEIRIERLHRKLHGRRLGKTKSVLSSMYRVQIRSKQLRIDWDLSPIPWDDSLVFLKKDDGSDAIANIDFEVEGRRVYGWVGALAPGSSSRGNAGFVLIRRGRVIRGVPVAWRPEAIFGPEPGRNDLINQRVTGELHLDQFDVSHTKDDIVWRTDEEDTVEDQIKALAADVIKIAREYRQKKEKPAREGKLSLDAVVEDAGLIDDAKHAARDLVALLEDRVPPRVHEAAAEMLVKKASAERDLMVLDLGAGVSARVVTTSRGGSSAPYLTLSKLGRDQWIFIVNAAHPQCPEPDDFESLRLHIQHVLADALALWALANAPNVAVGVVKDAMLRSMAGERS